ncbi:MAG: YbaB/EbfC family nucleoid-associated protein [Firmicutes bacterium]|nr:YbaB/EbfC family nucleoid-associated protein [Bacillota bacterium]
MGFNMQKLMKQAQKMQNDMAKAQEELKTMEVEGVSGGGMVRVVANGSQEILSIAIDPQIVDPEDVEMLEDMVLAAIKDALNAAQTMAAEKMAKITGGMGGGLPGMF